MPDLVTYQDFIACRLNNRYKAPKKRLFELFYYRIYGYSVSTEQSKRSAIPVWLYCLAYRSGRLWPGGTIGARSDVRVMVRPSFRSSKLILMACKRSRSARRRSSLPNFPRRKSSNHGKRGMTRKGKSYSTPKNRMPYAGPFSMFIGRWGAGSRSRIIKTVGQLRKRPQCGS
jgi:hypothetical protein